VKSDFKLSPAQLKAAITPRTRVVVLNSPSNPCSTMYSEAELRGLAKVVDDASKSVAPDIVILTDEMYEKIIYGGIPHFSIGSIPEVAERTVTVNGLSKSYAMTGWRIGYTVATGAFGKKLINAMGVLQGQIITNITSFIYPSIRTALTQCADEVESMRQSFAQRAELHYGLLRQIPGLECPRPTGAFYLFPDVSAHYGKTTPGGKVLRNSVDFAEGLLAEAKVVVIPGCEFGTPGDNHIRFTFACSEDSIRKGMQRVGEFVASLR
jgi:aspartate aminotransferase